MITKEERRKIQSAVMAGIETGNVDRARTVLTEFAELYPETAYAISLDVLGAYGIVLL